MLAEFFKEFREELRQHMVRDSGRYHALVPTDELTVVNLCSCCAGLGCRSTGCARIPSNPRPPFETTPASLSLGSRASIFDTLHRCADEVFDNDLEESFKAFIEELRQYSSAEL
jgi:hypothetical protein